MLFATQPDLQGLTVVVLMFVRLVEFDYNLSLLEILILEVILNLRFVNCFAQFDYSVAD